MTMLTTTAAGPGRDARIDALRGVAILGVLVLHFTLGYGLHDSPLGDALPRWLLGGLVLNGNYGVTMFFVVSGWLITSNSLRRWGTLERLDARAFYASRVARIVPPLLVVLALVVVLARLGLPHFVNAPDRGTAPSMTLEVASVLGFWHNVLMRTTGYANYVLDVYWSLSVEEVFYLALPLLCLGTRRRGLRLAAVAVFVACGPLYRWTWADDDIRYLYGYPACFDAITLGCLGAACAHRVTLAGAHAAALRLAAVAAMAATWVVGFGDHVVFGFTLMAGATTAYLLASTHAAAPASTWLALTRPLRWLGRRSYELYLTHILVLATLLDAFGRDRMTHGLRLPWLALFVALSCVAATAMARLVAEPANAALRRRLGGARGPRTGPALAPD